MMYSMRVIFQLFSIICFTFSCLKTQDYSSSPESYCPNEEEEYSCPARIKSSRGGAAEQLSEYKICSSHERPTVLTTSYGTPVDTKTASLTAGPYGPVLMQDTTLVDELAHFDRERIPERVVHTKGAGAFGYFTVTHDITRYTKANLFSKIGKKTYMAVRFSTVNGERGSSDIPVVREHRGFALKFYTDEGIWDIVGINVPMFLVRDPILFTSLVHSAKRNPVTNLLDSDSFWDFATLRPETVHEIMALVSDIGLPDGYRYMNGHGVNTFKLVNAKGEIFWCKFHYLTNQGIRNLSSQNGTQIRTTNPDYSTQDLYNAIHDGKFPSWTFYIQVMTPEQARSFRWNPFDPTKIWPQKEFPYLPVGQFVLNKNPRNYFKDVEQIALCPGHLVPGIEPSPDKVLQARILSYVDTQVYRLGANHVQLPVNCPFTRAGLGVHNQQRDGLDAYYNQGGTPNYYPNSFGGPKVLRSARLSPFRIDAFADRYESGNEDNFSQAADLYNSFSPGEQFRVAVNIVNYTGLATAQTFLQRRAINVFSQVNVTLAARITQLLGLSSQSS